MTMGRLQKLEVAPTGPTQYADAPDLAGNRPAESPIPPPVTLRTTAPADVASKEVDKKRVEMELRRRRYVKRLGGFLKGLHPEEVAKGEEVCRDYGRPPADGWDPDIFIPGFDNSNHEANQSQLKQKQDKAKA
jgi:hypothetical protein